MHQTRLTQYDPNKKNYKTNIPPAGDDIQDRHDNDGYTRFGFQNTRGVSIDNGLEIATEIDNMINLGVDIQGLSETNRPWSHTNKWKYNFMMEAVFQQSRTIFASSPSERTAKYQPGGNLLSITRHSVGRIQNTGQDPMGRFAWTTMRGKRDEGILVIVAYRVCQDHNSKAGAFTAYQQQCTELRKQGQKRPNPRQQILIDLEKLITNKRQMGYRPILMMDANGDMHHPTSPDKNLLEFTETTNLEDVF